MKSSKYPYSFEVLHVPLLIFFISHILSALLHVLKLLQAPVSPIPCLLDNETGVFCVWVCDRPHGLIRLLVVTRVIFIQILPSFSLFLQLSVSV